MTISTLPASPDPYPDELISSWIERIGLFYGIDYQDTVGILHARGGNPVPDPTTDFDSDPETRDLLCSWTERTPDQVPAILDSLDKSIMGPPARVVYCPRCWDDDCAGGRQPYIRARWTRWFSVHCPVHRVWLAARRPRIKGQSPLQPWLNIWRSNRRWAKAYESPYEPHFSASACGFAPETMARPASSWARFTRELEIVVDFIIGRLASPFADGALTARILGIEFVKLRRDVQAALQVAPPSHRLDDRDIICYPWERPVWLTERISCLVIAVEYVRFAQARAPLSPRLGELVRKAMPSDAQTVCNELIQCETFPLDGRNGASPSHS